MDGALNAAIEDYKRGIIEGYQVGWNNGFWNGCGAEKPECGRCLRRALPTESIILDSTVTDLLRIALEEKQDEIITIMTGKEVSELIREALATGRGISIIRIGESEALALAQDIVLTMAEINIRGSMIIPSISGVEPPDVKARDMLIESILKADIVGIPTPMLSNHLPLVSSVFKAIGIDLGKMRLTNSVINYELLYEGYLGKILKEAAPKVITVGESAEGLAHVLMREGVNVTGWVSSVKGMGCIDRVMEEVRRLDFDLALVPAAIPAVVICQRIATELGKTALDLGHCSNQLINGSAKLMPGL